MNSISVKSVWSVLLLEETSSHLRTLSHEIIWDTPRQGPWNLNPEVCKYYCFSFLYKRKRKPKRQSRMDNPGTLETQDTRMETNETNQKQHRNVNRTTPKTGINPSARDQQFLSLITPVVLLIYTTKSCKSRGSDRRKWQYLH